MFVQWGEGREGRGGGVAVRYKIIKEVLWDPSPQSPPTTHNSNRFVT